MLLIDKYAYTNNLTEINPKIKGSIGLIFLITSMAFKNIFCLISIITFMSALIVFLAKIDLKSYLKLVKIPMYFLIMGVLINLINISFDSKGLIYSLNIMSLNIGISNKSIITSVHILFRAIACLTCIYFFILTTPFNQIIFLLKKLHISDTVIELSMLVYRFIFIFLEEVSDIRKSQQLRFGYINLKTSYNSVGILGNMLFKRMMKRYDEMCISLDIKLYDSKFHIVGDENV